MKNRYFNWSHLLALIAGALIAFTFSKIYKPTEKFVAGPAPAYNYYPIDSLDNFSFRIFQNSHGCWVVPYNTTVKVTVAGNDTTLTDSAQGFCFIPWGKPNQNLEITKDFTTTTPKDSFMELLAVGGAFDNDSVRSITYAGPFDPINGHFYPINGQLHYVYSSGYDSMVCPFSRLVWLNQNGGPGNWIAVGYFTQSDVTY